MLIALSMVLIFASIFSAFIKSLTASFFESLPNSVILFFQYAIPSIPISFVFEISNSLYFIKSLTVFPTALHIVLSIAFQ